MSDGNIKGPADTLEFGKWNMICQRCGVKYKNDQIEKEWTGLLVCRDKCLESRNPQDFVRAVEDDQSVPDVSPPQDYVFVSVTYNTSVGIHDYTAPTGTSFRNEL